MFPFRLGRPRLAVPLPASLRYLPAPALRIVALLVTINILAWIGVAYPLSKNPKLLSPAALSYVLGLRHALDADHIAAIDLATRRLLADGYPSPVTVGTFFALGHSTVVIVTCLVVAAIGGAVRDGFGGWERIGGIVGGSVSVLVLTLFCFGNAWVLWRLVRRLKEVLRERREGTGGVDDAGGELAAAMKHEGGGLLARVFGKLFKVVDRPWKMLPLGLMFGLGFDTSSEIAVLGIASLHAIEGTNIWLILMFPVLFTAAMTMVDTADSALMTTLYTSKAFSRDTIAILYYSIVLTAITVFVSAFVAIVQIFSLVMRVEEPEGKFWDGVERLTDNFDIVGGCICGLFVVVGVGSVLVYRPWRVRVERRAVGQAEEDSEVAGEGSPSEG